MEILSSRSQASEGIPFRLQLLSSRSPKEVGCSDAKGSARSQCSGIEVAQAVLKLIIVQCGQGGCKGPDGHGSQLGNQTVVSFIRLSAKCGSKPSTCQNAARSGPVATLYGCLCCPTLRIATLYGWFWGSSIGTPVHQQTIPAEDRH